jgi:hypothetical protein
VSSAVPHTVSSVSSRTFRLPRLTYLVVVFLLVCTVPLAVAGDLDHLSEPVAGPRLALQLIPILAIGFVARTRTTVDPSGLRVRALFGSRQLPWDEVRGLSVSGRSVYAVCAGGSVRLPCVTVNDLAAIARASGDRLPAIAEPVRKYAPSRRRRRG